MQPYRITTRALPRVCKTTCPSPAKRTLFTTPFFPPSPISDLAPLFRLLDSATADLIPSTTTRSGARRAAAASFTPRFDVKELGSAYELQGELPGIEQKDLQIEFVDERTLVIRGRTSTEYESGDVPKAVEAGDASASAVDNAEASRTTAANNYRRPSVQEEEDYVDAGKEVAASDASSGPSSAEATTTKTSDNQTTQVAEQSQSQSRDVSSSSAQEQQSGFKYWISERSVGEFERRFSFPGRVDQEAVKASLRNGILSVVVPKIVKGEARRIQIE